MNTFLAQLILARRSEDAEKWMNILFVVVLAVFWAVGGILKARAKKTQDGDAGKSSGRPARRPPAQSSMAREQLLRQAGPPPVGRAERPPYRSSLGQARTRLAELRAAAQKFAAEAEQAFRVQIQEPAREVLPAARRPKSRPEPRDVLESLAKLPTAPQPENLPPPEETAPAPCEYLPELLSAYADPDQLRRAILHYEILGRPLALRDPQDSFAGL